jgi:hypothetical protein
MEMTDGWKDRKSKLRLAYLPPHPWKSQKAGFPHSHPHGGGKAKTYKNKV